MSWVFMAGDRVYKLKKPVRFAYLDFSTLDRRAGACRAEDLLNRRLAPDVYLGVVPLTLSTSGLAISGDGPVVDWLVVMRRLEENETLEAALRGRWLKSSQVDRVAATLGAFYAHAPRVQLAPEYYLVAWRKAINDNCRVLFDARFGLPQGEVERIAQVQRRFLMECRALLRGRIRARRLVDAHGDLRPEHIWLREPVTIIDCLEFDPNCGRSIRSMKSPSCIWNANASAACGLPKGSGGAWHVHWMTIHPAGSSCSIAAIGRCCARAYRSPIYSMRTPERRRNGPASPASISTSPPPMPQRLDHILDSRRKVRQRKFSNNFRIPGDR